MPALPATFSDVGEFVHRRRCRAREVDVDRVLLAAASDVQRHRRPQRRRLVVATKVREHVRLIAVVAPVLDLRVHGDVGERATATLTSAAASAVHRRRRATASTHARHRGRPVLCSA